MHIQLRLDFVIGPREELVRLRQEVKTAGGDFVRYMRNQLMGARIEGSCDGCRGDNPVVEK